MSFEGIEKRIQPRQPYYSRIDFAIIDDCNEMLKGFVVNMSDSGLCIHAFVPLRESQEITINLPSGRKKFVVRWCTRLFEDFFAAGLKAVE